MKHSEKFHHGGLSSRSSYAHSSLPLAVPRVVQFESAVQIRRCTSAKAKYCTETDSEQVVRTKDEKYFEKRVKPALDIVG